MRNIVEQAAIRDVQEASVYDGTFDSFFVTIHEKSFDFGQFLVLGLGFR